MNKDPLALLPEILLLAGAVGGLLLGSFLPRGRQWVVAAVGMAACAAGIGVAALAAGDAPETVYDGTYAIDDGLHAGRIVVLAATILALWLSLEPLRGHHRQAEFHVLTMLAALGAIALAGASDLLLVAAAYLLASVPLYALTGMRADAPGTEAAMKFYLLGALLGVVMLAGVAVVYGAAGATDYAALASGTADAPGAALAVGLVAFLAGLLFKMGAVPTHFWVPDVTEGASGPAAAIVTTIPKVGALIATFRLVDQALPAATVDPALLMAVLAAASMTLGNLAAFAQDSPRRLLAYSTVSQVGYMLMAVAVAGRTGMALPALLFYAAAYAVTNLGAFAVAIELPNARSLGDYSGLWRRSPPLALALTVCLLGLVGTPPTAVFVGKLETFGAAIDGGMAWLAALAVANTVASLFYYLRWIGPAVAGRPTGGDALAPAGRWTATGAYAAAVATVALGVAAGPVLGALDGPLVR